MKAHMTRLLKNLEEYLPEITGIKVTISPSYHVGLPQFFTRLYDLHHITIGTTSFIGVVLKHEDEFKPVQFIKHMHKVPSAETDEICIVAQSLPTYVRKRLIEKGVSFVIPGVQMYLPSIGMELRPRYGQSKSVLVEQFSPATQVVLIYWLLGRIQGIITPLELSKQLRYSAMSMSRVLDELEPTELAQVEKIGRNRLLTFTGDRKKIWEQARQKMRNPVTQTVNILEHNLHRQDALPAGMTALSHRSMLSENAYPEYAISHKIWNTMQKEGTEIIPIEEPGICTLQIWCYDPKLLEVEGQVDPFSLYLSFQNETDERIEMALEQMMEQYSW